MTAHHPYISLFGCFLSSVLASLLGSCGGEQQERPPSVLLISIDTLRADHVGCYGYGRPTTPNIDALAKEGVLFENHISSSSWTLPAHASLFTSVADSVHGCMESTGTALSPAFTTLAERFKDAGYETAGFYAGPYLHEVFGLGQGFDIYDYCVEDTEAFSAEGVKSWGLDPVAQQRSHEGVTNPGVYRAGRDWIKAHKGRPFFAFLHFWDVHYDFTPPAPWDTRFNPGYQGPVDGRGFVFDPSIAPGMPEADKQQLLALYDGEIGWTDTFVGRLRKDLEAWGLADDTIIVVTSDHGTEFFEHGGKGHRSTLYDELIRIPLVIWYPERLAPRRVSAQTRSIDVGPTLLELVDLPAPGGVMGHSLVPLALGRELDFDNAAISELYSVGQRLRSVRALESKFLVDENDPEPARWYDLQLDRAEMRPIRVLNTELGGRAQKRFLGARDELEQAISRRPGAAVGTNLPPEVLQRLRAEGYVGNDPDENPDEDEDSDDGR